MNISIKYIASQVLLAICLFFLAEIFVRHQGYAPGDLRPNWSNFHPVDSLIVYNDFIVDSTGILIANKDFFKTSNISINSNGFRAPEFADMNTVKHKILLIGDSFTWGLTAKPLDSCFADLLKTKVEGIVINTGIPSADPAQYEAIAHRYIPMLRPEKVIVMFYLGNDIMPRPRPAIPYKPFYYYTNAGAMMADDGPVHLNSAHEAYDYYTHQKFFLIHPVGFLHKVIEKSALLSRMYSLKYRWEEKKEADHAISDMSVTQKYLYSIVEICRRNHCALQVILIPEIKEADKPISFFEKRYMGFFADSILSKYTYIPEGNSPINYTPYPDGHLNNEGHRFYAQKIAERLAQMKKGN
jgi:lysophospholipase L1-like esterase